MAAFGPLVHGTPQGLEVKGRRRLEKPGAFEKMLEDLHTQLEQKSGQAAQIADLDISQNKLTYEQFEALFTQLGAAKTKVLRFRMFGCATLNDDVARVIGDYIRLLSQENAPAEMHLSDCAITTDGFLTFMSAFEETDIYPCPHNGSAKALYLRLENNYINEAAIQEKVDLGLIKPMVKNKGGRPTSDGNTKIDLVVQNPGKYQQKEGEPPSPEDAPPPKQVWDKYSDSQWGQQGSWQQGGWQQHWPAAKGGWQQGGVKGGGKGAWQQQGGWQQHWQSPAQRMVPGLAALPAAPRPIMPRAVAPRAATMISPKIVSPGGMKQVGGVVGGWPRGNAGTAQDRSRTPMARGVGNGAAKPPSGPPPGKKGSDLPAPWEEHWSDEYQIPYFWNAETGESLWEKPTA